MSYRIFCILLVFSSLFYSAQDIEVMEVTYENHISYLNFHNKKTVSHDEIDTSKNLSLITNNIPSFKDLKKCSNETVSQLRRFLCLLSSNTLNTKKPAFENFKSQPCYL